MRRNLCCFLLISLGLLASRAPAADKPNIIFILSDDLGMGDVGAYGQKLIETPNFDRMAAEGTKFTSAYCGTTVCAPSRASLMLGLHVGHSPVRGNRLIGKEGQLPIPANLTTAAEVLKQAGYATACAGKWGMGMFDTSGSPLKQGFDHFFGYNCQTHAHDYFTDYLYNDDKRFTLPGNDGKGSRGTYSAEVIHDDAMKWLDGQSGKTPFFLYYATTLPHGDYEIDDLGQYKDKDWPQKMKTYAAMVTRVDRHTGEILDLLKQKGLDDKTLVIMAGDNGSAFGTDSDVGKFFNQGATGFRGNKRSMYEGGLRQACLARWPGQVPAGKVSDGPWAFWDFLPTAAELAGVQLTADQKTDGKSIVPLLRGGDAPKRDYFYWELHERQTVSAVRFGNWKAVRNSPKAPLELYDLSADPGEKNNVAARHPEQVAQAEKFMKEAHADDPNWPVSEAAAKRGKGKGKKAKAD